MRSLDYDVLVLRLACPPWFLKIFTTEYTQGTGEYTQGTGEISLPKT
jgi:hypothetical protein